MLRISALASCNTLMFVANHATFDVFIEGFDQQELRSIGV
jgi:hypothetical protein